MHQHDMRGPNEDSFEDIDLDFVRLAKEEKMREEVIRRQAEEQMPGFFSTDFGPWTFDPEALLLVHGEGDYVIPLERITSSACMLDWIFQIQSKEWADPHSIFCLLVAFRRIFDPQKNLCSFEEDKEIDGEVLARAYAERTIEYEDMVKELHEYQHHVDTVLALLTDEKPKSVSFLIESVDFPREKMGPVLSTLEQVGVITYDRENRYVVLTLENVKKDLIETVLTTEEKP